MISLEIEDLCGGPSDLEIITARLSDWPVS